VKGPNARSLYLTDDRQHVSGMAIRKRLDGRCRQFTGFRELGAPSFTPRAFAAARAALVRVAIIARSFSASAAKGEG
jgi:hypothetical protein